MMDRIAANVSVYCKDCGHPLEIIEQEELDNGYFLLVTCWQATCLLRGFTLSLDRYESLNQPQLEVYREMNQLGRPQYVRVD
ncbi:MAG: hypothetical protein H0X30_06780 [Anaerolineae bacterium]|nr:hypothetical protein [Anaerolineae bacterium]